jgi:hypothetical protein
MKPHATSAQLIFGAIAAIAAGCPALATAQLRAPADVMLIDPIRLRSVYTNSAESFTNASFSLVPSPGGIASGGWAPWEPTANRLSLVEMPADGGLAQRTRPHYALGFTSETMRSWLTDMGVEASNCIAPIIRLRTGVDANGDFRGTLWVHARCSLR